MKQRPQNPDYFQLADIAKAVGRHKNTIFRWELEGRIPRAARDEHGWRYYTKDQFDAIIRLVQDKELEMLDSRTLAIPPTAGAMLPTESEVVSANFFAPTQSIAPQKLSIGENTPTESAEWIRIAWKAPLGRLGARFALVCAFILAAAAASII